MTGETAGRGEPHAVVYWLVGLLALIALILAGRLVVAVIDLTTVHTTYIWCADGSAFKSPDNAPSILQLCNNHNGPNPNPRPS